MDKAENKVYKSGGIEYAERKNRLLSINTYHYRRGGSETVYFDHAELFHRHGWETGFFAMRHPENDSSEWERHFVEEMELGSGYGKLQKLNMAGKVIYSFEAKRKIESLIRNWRPDIAHAHLVYHHLSPSILGPLRKKGIPTVMTAHDLKVICPAYKMLNNRGLCEKCKHGNLVNVALNRCIHDSLPMSMLIMLESVVHRLLRLYKRNLDAIVTPSRFYKEKFLEWGWPENKLKYIPNFLNMELYEANYKPGDYFLYFGRLTKEKGIDTLIQAAEKAAVKLKIAGTGPEETALKQLAIDKKVDLEFLGYCTGEKLWEVVRRARAVVLPSQWYENAPMSVLESYACGKIVIGARIGGIPELVKEGETGFLFNSADINDCAFVLQKVSQLPNAMVEEMGRLATKYVLKNHTQEIYYAKMNALYERIGVYTN